MDLDGRIWMNGSGWKSEVDNDFYRDRLLADGVCDKYNVPSVSSISRYMKECKSIFIPFLSVQNSAK